MRLALLACLGLWAGTTLVLADRRWFARVPLHRRLRAYAAGDPSAGADRALLSPESVRDVVAPLARDVGERIARLLGVHDDTAMRLSRVHADGDIGAFRVRQVGWMTACTAIAALSVAALRAPALVAAAAVIAAPAVAFLVVEQRLATASARWQRRIFLELPVVAEQLAMLLSAGYSLASALTRLSTRGSGACASDLRRVVGRVRQGLSEVDALREWAAVAGVPALDRLVPVLELNRATGDLGRLVSEEARAIRRDVQRELVQTMERRAQQVWIPVTVATLVPGVVFLAIPFIEALRLFSS
ncbi:MAG TPA: type II secretion system F family protein [Acidimicrobiales bacterium]